MKIRLTSNGIKITRIISGRSNVFLINSKDTNILVDTGVKSVRRILDKRLEKMSISRIDCLILTHTHFDHAENAAWVREKYQAKVFVQKEEIPCIMTGKSNPPQGTNPFTRFLINFLARPLIPFLVYTPCKYDIAVESRYDLTEYGVNAYILHTPGHTKGSVSVIVDDEVALAGDTLFGVFRNSVFPPFADDVKMMIRSWQLLLNTGCKVFLPSHGSAVKNELLRKELSVRQDVFPNDEVSA